MAGHLQSKPPDGGYGWIVMLCSMGTQILAISFSLGNSMLMVEFSETFGKPKAVVSLPGATYTSVNSIAAIFVGGLIHSHGPRLVCMIGAVIGCCGVLGTSFAPNIYTICVTYGILGGIGGSCIFLSSLIVVQQYFENRRAFAAGIASLGQSLSSLLTGPVYTMLIYNYGWRGAVIVHAGIVLQAVVLGSFYRPLTAVKRSPLGDSRHEPSKAEDKNKEKKACSAVCSCIDPSLMKQKLFLVYLLGIVFSGFGVTTVYHFHPSRAVYIGMTKMEAALVISCLGLVSTVSRIVNSFVANMSCTNRVFQIGLANIYGGAVACLTNLCTNRLSTFFAAALYGVSVGTIGAIQSTVLTDLVGRERLSRGIALATTVRGAANLLALPFAGWLFDVTQSFEAPFYAAGSFQTIGGVIILVVYALKKREDHKKDLKLEANQELPMVAVKTENTSPKLKTLHREVLESITQRKSSFESSISDRNSEVLFGSLNSMVM